MDRLGWLESRVFSAAIAVALGCGTNDDDTGTAGSSPTSAGTASTAGEGTDGETSAGTTMGLADDCKGLSIEVECGEYGAEPDCDSSGSSEGSDTGVGDTGGSDTGASECAAALASTNACVAMAMANGEAFVFTQYWPSPTGGFFTSLTLGVAADGSGWIEQGGGDGICTYDSLWTHGPVDLSGCSDVACLVERLRSAERASVCMDLEICDE